jgi:hypothetical protein
MLTILNFYLFKRIMLTFSKFDLGVLVLIFCKLLKIELFLQL